MSALTAVGMTIGVLIESSLGGPTTSSNTSGRDRKGGGAREDKALTAPPRIIGLILSWILNRAKEVVGWLSQNLWALITGAGVLIYTYFMTKTRK